MPDRTERVIDAELRYAFLWGLEGALPNQPQAQVIPVGEGTLLVMIQAIDGLTLEGLPSDGLHLDDRCVIWPSGQEVAALMDPRVVAFIGMVNAKTILEATAVNFIRQDADEEIHEDSAEATLRSAMAWTQQFLFSLWLVKDNSGSAGDGHLFLVKESGESGVISLRPGVMNFTADCHRKSVNVSRAELGEAISLFERVKAITPQGEWRLDEPRPSGLVFDSRIVRTIYYAQAARAHAEIAVKLAFQCLCFESLFASSSDSIRHRVSERPALLVGTGGQQSRVVYDDITALYKARSSIVHGDPIAAKRVRKLQALAVRADEHLRRAIRGILETPALLALFSANKAEDVDDYFLERILSDSVQSAPRGTGDDSP